MKTRKLGDLELSAVSMGCMRLSHGYGAAPEKLSIQLIHQVYDLGCTFFDTAEGYAKGDNEYLVGEALNPIRDKIVLATKFHISDQEIFSHNSLFNIIEMHLDGSFKRLATDQVELYYLHRVNKNCNMEKLAFLRVS